MNTTDQRKPELLEEVEKLLAASGISQEKQEEIFEKATQLIILKSINKLDSLLPAEAKSKLVASSPHTLDDVAKYYKGYFSGEELRNVFIEATESVIIKIIDSV